MKHCTNKISKILYREGMLDVSHRLKIKLIHKVGTNLTLHVSFVGLSKFKFNSLI